MSRWPSNKFRNAAGHLDESSINAALEAAHAVQDQGLPAILTLNHLARHVDVPYRYLREVVERQRDPYRSFRIRKRRGGFRMIVVPEPNLMRTQRWLARYVLNRCSPHPHSRAYGPGNTILECAQQHCGARWLVKVDVQQFFESITEIQAYRVFESLGYGGLISFEMARLVSRVLPENSYRLVQPQWQVRPGGRYSIGWYDTQETVGYLPQGAPTSPMLSNLAMRRFDLDVAEIADSIGLVHTRYSDDIHLSTHSTTFNREDAVAAIRRVSRRMNEEGLRPHHSKTSISPPGSRKIVLGLLVDQETPKLRREFKRRLECHIHFIRRCGPIAHAKARNFDSTLGLKRHIEGLLVHASEVEPDYAAKLRALLGSVPWPA